MNELDRAIQAALPMLEEFGGAGCERVADGGRRWLHFERTVLVEPDLDYKRGPAWIAAAIAEIAGAAREMRQDVYLCANDRVTLHRGPAPVYVVRDDGLIVLRDDCADAFIVKLRATVSW
jgi:hypothetical protein